jgi:hypothetical protein
VQCFVRLEENNSEVMARGEEGVAIPSQASDDDAKILLSAVASGGCESHVKGISQYSRSRDNEA